MSIEPQVQDVLDEISGYLESDDGGVELVRVNDLTVFIKLTGACAACEHANITFKNGIEKLLRMKVDENIVLKRTI